MKKLPIILFCLWSIVGCCQVKSTVFTNGEVIVLNADGSTDTIPSPSIEPREYIALLSQDATAAPTAVVLKNTIGLTPTWAYTTTGTYTASVIADTPPFLVDKTVCTAQLQTRGSNPRTYSCGRTGDRTIVLHSMNSSLALSDPATSNQILVKIQVFY
jgi:hypothetical protein